MEGYLDKGDAGNVSSGLNNPSITKTDRTDAPTRRLRLGNVPLDQIGFYEAVDLIADWVRREPFRLVVTPNVDHVVRLQHDASFRAAYQQAALSLPDGKPVLWGGRWLGLPPLEKISGSDLLPALCVRGAAEGWRVFFAAGRSSSDLRRCLRRIRDRFPGLELDGVCPPWGFERDSRLNTRLFETIATFRPNLVVFACGTPKSEIWLARYGPELGRGVGISIGAGFEMLAGFRRRAPRWIQWIGLEWFWRLLCEPHRLWRRYLLDDMKFFPLLWKWRCEARKQ